MYSSYSPLQRRQLREQTYTDTQSTYLLVYAPGRRNALTLSLAEQLHRKFRLVDRLEGERCAAGERGCGVHLHRPHLFCSRLAAGG